MKRFTLFKSLLVAAGLLVGSSAWAADESEYSSIWSQDFETEAKISDNITLTGTSKGSYKLGQLARGTGFCLRADDNSTNGGNAVIALPDYSSFSEYILRFEWAGYSSNGKGSALNLRGASSKVLVAISIASFAEKASVQIGSEEALSTTLAVTKNDKATRDNPAATNFTFYTIEVVGKADGTTLNIYDASANKVIAESLGTSLVRVNDIQFNLGNALSHMAFDNLILKGYSDVDVVSEPSIDITGVAGTSRTVSITNGTSSKGNTVTTYYTTNGDDPTVSSDVYSTPLVIDAACTIKALSVTASGSSTIASKDISVEAITLKTPTWTKTAYNATTGTSTVTLASDQSSVLLKPTATIYYSINGGADTKYTAAIEVPDEAELTYYATATGYTDSPKGSVTAGSPFLGSAVWQEKYVASSDKQGITLGSTVKTTIGGYNYYEMTAGTDGSFSDHLYAESTDGYFLYRTGGLYTGNARNLAIADLKKNQYLIIAANKELASVSNLTKDTWNSVGGLYCYYVAADGDVVIRFNKEQYVTSITLKDSKASATIGTAGWATLYTDAALDFSAATPTGLEAYTAAYDEAAKTVTLTKVDDVQAGTGVVLKGSAGTYSIPVIAASSTEKGDLKGSTTTATACTEEAGIYMLAKNGENAQFKKATSGSIAAGKAYLQISGGGDASLRVVIEGEEATGVHALNAADAEDVVTYNVAGQRVSGSYKGIVIKNGKKYLNK